MQYSKCLIKNIDILHAGSRTRRNTCKRNRIGSQIVLGCTTRRRSGQCRSYGVEIYYARAELGVGRWTRFEQTHGERVGRVRRTEWHAFCDNTAAVIVVCWPTIPLWHYKRFFQTLYAIGATAITIGTSSVIRIGVRCLQRVHVVERCVVGRVSC